MTALYREQPPRASLSRWVACLWSLTTAEGLADYGVPPDGCLDIVYWRGKGLRAIGAMTVEQRFEFSANSFAAGIRFLPGMASPFLRTSASELTDGFAPLEDLWGASGRNVGAQLDDATSPDDCMALLEGAIQQPPTSPNAIQRAIEEIVAAHGDVDLEFIADQANLSSRQFRRRCSEESGLTPKHLCRVLRFCRARGLAAGSTPPNWSAIAAETGYFDQAHLIRDFREFTLRTPVSVFSNTHFGA